MIAFQGNRGVSTGLECLEKDVVRGEQKGAPGRCSQGGEAESSHGLRKFRELNTRVGQRGLLGLWSQETAVKGTVSSQPPGELKPRCTWCTNEPHGTHLQS